MQNLQVWDALIAWRDEIFKKDVFRKSKIDYLSNMERLIETGVVDLEKPLSKFIENGLEMQLKQINSSNWSLHTKQTRCTLLRSFYRFAKTKRIRKSDIVIPFIEYRELRKVAISEILSPNEIKAQSQSLTEKQLESFFNEIRRVNERDFLICWTMWQLKCTIHQVLDFKVEDYYPEIGVFKISKDEFRLGEIRPELKELILKQCEGKKRGELIFSTDTGRHIHAGQIVRRMKMASKLVKLPIIISPTILYARSIAYGKETYMQMSDKERKLLSKKYEEACKNVKSNCENNEKRL